MSDGKSGAFIGGVLLGSMIGTVTGLLMAPRTGRETRQVLKKSADAMPELLEDLSTSLHLQADRLSETALQNWEQTLVRLRDAIAAGQAASRREYETLQREQRVHPGEPSVKRD
ncbi:MAG: YtxH domain-containing protein [Leptolyngbya sp. SIO4C1]|nr:YtxH domain-containing protein [Leptolyngbya sp. SIO4C1]